MRVVRVSGLSGLIFHSCNLRTPKTHAGRPAPEPTQGVGLVVSGINNIIEILQCQGFLDYTILFLALRAIVRPAACDYDFPDRRFADQAGLALAAVGAVL